MSVTKKYLHDVDLVRNKLMNPLLNPMTSVERIALGASLTTADEGYATFDTTLNNIYFWDGAAWITTGGGSAVWGSITGTLTAQTDLTLYLSTNYYPLSTNPAGYLTSATAASTYEPIISAGTTSQYWRGDKTWQTFPTIPTVGTWGALNYPTWTTGTPFVKMTAVGTFALDTNTYLTSAVTNVTATAPLVSSGGNTPDISTSMATNRLIGRTTVGVGVMEEITVGTGLSLSGGTLTATVQSVGFEMNFLLMGA